MWLCLNQAFLSIVNHPESQALLLVRARRPGDIEQVFPEATVVRMPGRDYVYRAAIERTKVGSLLAFQVLDIDYPNFKNSVANAELHDAYAKVWSVMAGLQAVRPYGKDSQAACVKEDRFLQWEKRPSLLSLYGK